METGYISTPGDSMPVSTTAVMPSITATAQAFGTAPQPGLTPASLLNPMPSITNSTPLVVGQECSGISQWINDNPLLAAGILAGFAFLVFGGGSKEHHAK